MADTERVHPSMSIGTLLYVRDVESNINEQLIKFLSATADRIKKSV